MKLHYTLSVSHPAQHLLDVEIAVTGAGRDELDFVLPSWTPGSYLIREYARQVQEVAATADGEPVSVRQLDKQTWRVAAGGARDVCLRYRVYGYELTVRTNHVDDTHAHVIPAATFMYLAGAQQRPVSLRVVAPDGWQTATGLRHSDDGWLAADYDELVDCPLEIGQHRTLAFEVDAIAHRIVVWGDGNLDEHRLTADVSRIVEAARDIFGGLPYHDYTFFLLLGGRGAGGGLEHRNSTSLLLPRLGFSGKGYERCLSLFAHEYFHVWNVKRIRAAGLGPFDYTREAYTTLLWVMEGFTVYYTDLLLLRAGLIDRRRYLERLAEDIVTLQSTPGRHVQTLEQASFNAWIKFYRPDENTPNTAISYYLKGGLVALLIDLELRARSSGERSLDDVLRYLYRAFPYDGPGIADRAAMLDAIEAATGQRLDDLIDTAVDSTAELPLDEALAGAGLCLEWDWKDKLDGRPRPTLGLRTKHSDGQLRVAAVLLDGPAWRAGVSAGDELVALDGYRVLDEAGLNDLLRDRRAGELARLTLFRLEQLRTIEVSLAEPPRDKLEIRELADADEQQLYVRAGWLAAPEARG